MADSSSGLNIPDTKKSHRERNSGRKADRKKAKKDAVNPVGELSDKQRNPKAFAFNSAIRAERKFRRKQDIDTKKQHIPLVDRTPIEPPPILIAIVGPPKVGKTTVMNNLIRLFTKSPMAEIKGPVTIVTGKKRRITLVECNNDLNSMIDLAKVADLVLLLCDASFGFEMEIFEFLNICQVHGMPRIMGVLTHLDMIKSSKALKTAKKTLKHRFWTEVYAGAKLFYLSGIVHGEYLRNEIKNLGRFISVMKFRPLTWRSTHSYLLADRYEDLTNQELVRQNPKCDRNVSLYGYIRGVPLPKNSYVHVAGFGDLQIQDMSFLPDPCPLPETIKKRALIEKEKLIYAPFSGVGGIVYDKDAVYVELGGSHSHNKRNAADNTDETHAIVTNLIDARETLDVKMQHSEMRFFSGSKAITAMDMDNDDSSDDTDDDDSDDECGSSKKQVKLYEKKSKKADVNDLDEELKQLRNENGAMTEENVVFEGRTRRKVVFNNSDEEMEKQYTSESDDDDDNMDDDLSLKRNKFKDIKDKVANAIKDIETKRHENSDTSEDDSDGLSDDNVDVDSDNSMSEDDGDDGNLKWKDNMAQKAEESYFERKICTKNLMKIVYGTSATSKQDDVNGAGAEDGQGADEELGGLFRKVSDEEKKKKIEKDSKDMLDSTLMMPWNDNIRNWLEDQNKELINDCFVTGKWQSDEDADELLRLDAAEIHSDDDDDLFGDFEDLETGQKFVGNSTGGDKTKDASNADDSRDKKRKADIAPDREKLAEKKRKLKERFDAEYDNGGDKSDYYNELKSSTEKQAQLNKSVFDGMADEMRVQIEGYRSGMYVRMEFERVPSEFVEHFDPTYPLVIGALNVGEQNIGYVNVKIKKHRWYKRILKANDPVIISLGWRRFQTMPLYAKLEDDMKFRYLKYTPPHLSCNAHFWGPITPQGTGFLALQSVNSNPEVVKQQGFRIAATGVVQELTKSTEILKKLKLIGYPMKIYKKTAFIKGMFNSSLEVARFEGARIKAVSGVRGQIKKAVNKPEGCFRATFEDKILLSDIVFCRTWYKVDVKHFYNPVTTLLLPPDQKNSWRGMRTTGELKREKGIRVEPNTDHLYTDIEREPKVFKPFVVPAKLQKALPYRDKPKDHGSVTLSSEGRKVPQHNEKRVAVVREPREQKVANMMKMIRATYEQKQTHQAEQTKQRLAAHREQVEFQDGKRTQKIKQEKKQVFRRRTKAAIIKEKGGGKRRHNKQSNPT